MGIILKVRLGLGLVLGDRQQLHVGRNVLASGVERDDVVDLVALRDLGVAMGLQEIVFRFLGPLDPALRVAGHTWAGIFMRLARPARMGGRIGDSSMRAEMRGLGTWRLRSGRMGGTMPTVGVRRGMLPRGVTPTAVATSMAMSTSVGMATARAMAASRTVTTTPVAVTTATAVPAVAVSALGRKAKWRRSQDQQQS